MLNNFQMRQKCLYLFKKSNSVKVRYQSQYEDKIQELNCIARKKNET